jgi:hypothetical protein
LKALAELHDLGIRTYAMIAPLLPGAESLAELLSGTVDYILIDRMNYHYADHLYRRFQLEEGLSDGYFAWAFGKISNDCERLGIRCTIVS